MPLLVATERKTVRTTIKQAGEGGSFEAEIATFGVRDHDDDVVEHGAFGGATVSVLPAHQAQHVPLGKGRIEERGDQAVVVGQFNMDITAARDWHSALKFDLENPPSIQEWSWDFKVVDSSEDTIDGVPVRRLTMLDVKEVSPVLRGASIGTGTLSVKRLKATGRSDNDRRELLQAAITDAEKGAEFLWVEAVFDDVVVYTMSLDDEASKTFERDYSLADDGAVKLGDQRRQVVREVSYRVPAKGDDEAPAIKLADEIRWVIGDVDSVVHRVLDVAVRRKAEGRGVGEPVSLAALDMADTCRELDRLMKGLRDVAVEAMPDGEVAKAVAQFLHSEASLLGV